MRAAYITENGEAKDIKVGDLPKPEISKGEVLIKVNAVSVNHVDAFVRSGSFKTETNFPFVIGRDAVGQVEEVGADVTGFSKGNWVWTNSMGYAGRQGVTSEYAAIPATRLFHVPEKVEPTQLVASVHSSATAAIVLTKVFGAVSGSSILVEGAAGHVGTKFVQMAHIMGLKVVTTSNSSDFDLLDRLGSDERLDYGKSLKKQLAKADIQKVDYVVDTSGQVPLQDNLQALNPGGTVCLITAPKNNKFSFDVRKFYTQSKTISGFVISNAPLDQIQDAAKFINRLMADGYLLEDSVLEKSYEDAAWAHKKLEKNSKKKKILLTF
ncbi:zinc-binding dehydrogenase [Lentilactobacillus otakiensis]|uniref:Alcohol dehydrogenase zinc-binding domain-containing protein n=1 Tax=Lentilactobacillus otakiensis DSM 19908 = JCM 15040 TaxID=1423780 RepID=S4NKN7_9LACO|nr:zinc-binding dehydrogenase [Lentilactobacillus otakiensis]MBZ3776364.1 zinc-binding dehydrogenase [Lentilactobacillus otakiensis]GAD16481.1 alcohol dehydrogenase zinc-binding domain-containing protein [Lentilactobacillus otakiensis DSM 19908 = JCM 15040]